MAHTLVADDQDELDAWLTEQRSEAIRGLLAYPRRKHLGLSRNALGISVDAPGSAEDIVEAVNRLIDAAEILA